MIVNKNAKSLEESVFFALEEEILSGKLKRGETLTEISLSQRLGVSRTPIRGALSRLGDEGLVEIHPNRGAVVVGIGDEELQDIYKIRIRLEGLASAEAALPQGEVYRRRFAEYSTHVRRSIESARMYKKFANSASFVIGREKTEIPRLNSYAITGKVAPRGSRTWMRRGNDGLYISHWSRYAPFGAEGPKDKCAYVDLLLAPGEAPSNVYRISLYANGSVYDCRRQLDPPRAPDDKYDVKGLKLESKADDAARLWTFEAFVPWTAFDEGAPKAGEKWRMNVLGANPIGEKGYGISSIAPTMGDPWRTEFYGTVVFE